ncbi:unnamed protein product [Ilex paraguariensis]|uniref:Uncharacterized protein n=1 Tax=Ilex paraguariensis TaxID=185542 RepID=A0ABC8SYW3_9AQUA
MVHYTWANGPVSRPDSSKCLPMAQSSRRIFGVPIRRLKGSPLWLRLRLLVAFSHWQSLNASLGLVRLSFSAPIEESVTL